MSVPSTMNRNTPEPSHSLHPGVRSWWLPALMPSVLHLFWKVWRCRLRRIMLGESSELSTYKTYMVRRRSALHFGTHGRQSVNTAAFRITAGPSRPSPALNSLSRRGSVPEVVADGFSILHQKDGLKHVETIWNPINSGIETHIKPSGINYVETCWNPIDSGINMDKPSINWCGFHDHSLFHQVTKSIFVVMCEHIVTWNCLAQPMLSSQCRPGQPCICWWVGIKCNKME